VFVPLYFSAYVLIRLETEYKVPSASSCAVPL
jgi:hypothetical protein